ncbi:MAG: ABC transporter permease [Bacilli bacterium]|nr:ABC transporter permease [Bacilli bacterium]
MVKKIFANIYIYLILFLMYLPILLLVVFSFTESANIGVWTGFSFDLFPRLFQSHEIMVALGNTIIIALISSIVSVLLGTLGAIGTFYSKKRSKRAIEAVTQIPVVNAEIVMALSLTVLFVFLGTYIFRTSIFSFFTLLIGHVCLSLPFVYLSVKPKLQQMDPNLYEAAMDLGCTPRIALFKAVIPQIIPGVISGFLLSMTLSLDDFIVSAFLRGPGLLSGDKSIETLSTLVQAKIKKGPIPPELRALTTILFLLILTAIIVITIYRNHFARNSGIKRKLRRMKNGVR